jgi:predicted transcriptional regulator of viral defense system
MEQTAAKKLVKLARKISVLRARDLAGSDISRVELSRLVRKGTFERIGRGLYQLVGYDVSEHHSLAEAQLRVPNGIVCLLSALSYHEFTTQAPFEVWMAIGIKARKPSIDYPPIRIVRFSALALTTGIEEHTIEGVHVKITSTARTVADCFKYRNKIGLDVAIEALRDYLRKHLGTIDDLWQVSRICRVTKIMLPYIEAMTLPRGLSNYRGDASHR